MNARDTIYALSTAPGKAAVAVVRVSGPEARAVLERVAAPLPVPRRAGLRLLRAEGGAPVDQALILWLPGPASFTGEDMAELQVHGGRAVVRAVLDLLAAQGLRLAEPGEFARRAFLNGRLDLASAEATADLIDAETQAQRRLALRGMDGGLQAQCEAWRARLVESLALIEAHIDFVDEEDVPADLMIAVARASTDLAREIAAALAPVAAAERIREGIVIAVTGAPNVGKSSLLNRIARRDVAIVSEHAGTTRDTIEVFLDLAGYPVTLVDTAGIRDATDPVEQEGIRRALKRVAEADLVLEVREARAAGADDGGGTSRWLVLNKGDLAPGMRGGPHRFVVSAHTGQGLDELLAALTSWVTDRFDSGMNSLVSHERQRQALAAAQQALEGVGALTHAPELAAEALRRAALEIGRVTGRVGVEEVLGAIFGRFCIGK